MFLWAGTDDSYQMKRTWHGVMKIIVVSDIHGNWPALRAVFESESTFDGILCLGDLVDYGPFPVECVQWAIEMVAREWIFQGNHDRAVGRNEDSHCSPAYMPLAEETQALTSRLLPWDAKEFLARLKPAGRFLLNGAKCFACHALPSDPLYSYLAEGAPAAVWNSEIAAGGHPEFLFLGHTHLPMTRQFQQTLVVNPGSVGQPKHGDPRAAYAIWDDGSIVLRRVSYDVEETIRGYDGQNIDPHVLNSLTTVLRTGGELPSEDIHLSIGNKQTYT
jgi:predicted phosphodiesterase